MTRSSKSTWIILLTLPGLVVACGGGDESEEEEKTTAASSFGDLVSGMESPTGKLTTSNAVQVADQFEQATSSGLAGERRVLQADGTGSVTIDCPAGGSMSTVASAGSQTEVSASYSYDNCCYTADCCYSGGGNIFYSADTAATFTYCASYDLQLSCGSDAAEVDYVGCLGADGSLAYSIEVEGLSYAVSGNYSNGSGTLTISDSENSWTCTYTDSAGSCTAAGGDELSF